MVHILPMYLTYVLIDPQRLASQREESIKRRVSRGPRASVNMTWTPAMGPPRSKQGFALKKGHLFTSMKRRYFTVEEGFITYYENYNKVCVCVYVCVCATDVD